MELIRGIVDPRVQLKLSETQDKSVVDGVDIIGVMEGNFFVPDGISRNKRFYSKSLWERSLGTDSVKEKLANRAMYGTIGHDTPVNDESLAKGLLTHITDKLYIDEKGNGIGRALILNTTAGRNLKTVLGAKGKVYVSSRALGSFEGKTKHGVPKVKEEDYELKGFDAVLDPGFLEANPKLKEALEYPDEGFRGMINECYDILEEKTVEADKIINEDKQKLETKHKQEKLNMDLLETVQTMTVENTKIKLALEEAMKSQEKAETDSSVLQSENESLRKQIKEQEDEMDKKKKDDEEDDEKDKEESKVKAAEAKVITDAIKAFMKEAEKEDDEEDDDEKDKKGKKGVNPFEAFQKFVEDVGTAATIKEALTALEAKLDEQKAFEKEFGTNEEIKDLLSKYEALGDKQASTAKETQAEKLATELGVPQEKVEALLAKEFDEDSIKEFFKDIKEAMKVKNQYSRKTLDESKDESDPNNPFRQSMGEKVLSRMRFENSQEEDSSINEDKVNDLGTAILAKLV